MAGSRIDGIALGAIGAGALLTYSGVKGYGVLASVRNIISGKAPASGQSSPGLFNVTAASTGTSAAGNAPAAPGNTGAANAGAAANQAIARTLAAPYGWSAGTQWNDLVSLWNRESEWDNTADNSASGAYGIPQALPYTKMPKAAWPPSAGGSASATAQISWGLQYIQQTYGSPSAAWAHEESAGWY